VHHPKSLEIESRVIVNLLSQRAMTMSAPFSSDLVSTTSYRIKKTSIRLKRDAEAAARKKTEDEDGAVDPDLLKDEISIQLQKKLKRQKTCASVREKSGMWGYKTVVTKLDGDKGPGELLDLRTKQGRDKYCW